MLSCFFCFTAFTPLSNRSPQVSPQLARLVFFATVFAANFNCRLVKLLLSGKGPSAYPKKHQQILSGNSESSSYQQFGIRVSTTCPLP